MVQHGGVVVWLTGLSGSGKSTIALRVHEELTRRGVAVEILDGDDVRKKQNSHLGFSKEDRDRNVRSIGSMARMKAAQGSVVLVAAIAPYRSTRAEIRSLCERYLEVFVDAPLAVCESRDPKGLYRRARNGEIADFTGIHSPYEPPHAPDVHCLTELETLEESAVRVVTSVLERSLVYCVSSGDRR